jgi:hypothetical protein
MRIATALEQCPHCLQWYSYELEHRCVSCDGALCPFCVVRVEVHCFCLGCKEETDVGPRDMES